MPKRRRGIRRAIHQEDYTPVCRVCGKSGGERRMRFTIIGRPYARDVPYGWKVTGSLKSGDLAFKCPECCRWETQIFKQF